MKDAERGLLLIGARVDDDEADDFGLGVLGFRRGEVGGVFGRGAGVEIEVEGASTSIASGSVGGLLVCVFFLGFLIARVGLLLLDMAPFDTDDPTLALSSSSSPSSTSFLALFLVDLARFAVAGGAKHLIWAHVVSLSSCGVESARKRARFGSTVCLPS